MKYLKMDAWIRINVIFLFICLLIYLFTHGLCLESSAIYWPSSFYCILLYFSLFYPPSHFIRSRL